MRSGRGGICPFYRIAAASSIVAVLVLRAGHRTLEVVHALLASASLGESLSSFFDAVGQFFSDLAAVHWGLLLLGLVFFGLNLTLRSRAFFHSLRAAYPAVSFQWRRIWGAYFAAVGFNNVVPGARRRRHQAVPDALLDPRLELSDGGRGVLRGVDLRR